MINSQSFVKAPADKISMSTGDFVKITTGLATIVAAIHFLHIEENLNLAVVTWLAAAGFILYAYLPFGFRLPFLFALNVVAIFLLLGISKGIILLLFALCLFGILNLPFSVRIKTLLIVGAGLLLAFGRMQLLPMPFGNEIIPVLAGLFMFRSILFLHEQKFAKKQVSIWLRLNYFFLLPNLVFVIFPVVDYKTFINNYYTKPSYELSRKGVLWMANGVLHLFCYRLVYYYLIPNPSDIQGIYGLLQFVICSYLLIIRLAGIFHFSAGVICLFGFDLPRTFNHYFFADSFSDLWRRVNIYWRDFVIKVIYYPLYFKIKRIGTIRAIAVSILITFAFNWFLHAYQWFWIRGAFLFTFQDVSFWALFGITVMLNSIYQAQPRKKREIPAGFSHSTAFVLALRILGIFMFMTFLWSWWTTPSVSAWLGLMSLWKNAAWSDYLFLTCVVVAVALLGVVIQRILYNYRSIKTEKKFSDDTVYKLGLAGIAMLALTGTPAMSQRLEKYFDFDMEPVLHTQLNDADRETQFKGYYETMLAATNPLNSPLDEIQKEKPDEWKQLHTLNALVRTNDLITKQLKPNLDITFKGARFQTNALGLRDRPVTKQRPPGTLRMALLGGSIEMGTGVTTDETYENLVEDRLTKEQIFAPYDRVEIINFGVPGIHMPQHIARMDRVVPGFNPQVVIYTAHSDEIRRIMSNLYRVYADSLEVEYEYLNNLFASLDLPRTVDEGTFKRAIRPKMNEVIAWGLLHIKQKAESLGAIPVWMFVPALDGKYTPSEDEHLYQQARALGFYILDLRNFNENIPENDIILGKWDRHPNALGHKLMAEKMYRELRANKSLVKRITDTYPAP